MTSQFKKIIDDDIAKGKEIVEKRDKQNCKSLHAMLISKYTPIIEAFDDNLHSLFYDETMEKCLENISIMVSKLELFKAMEYQNINAKMERGVTINNNNTNTNSIELNTNFEQAKKEIENMTALTDKDVIEILSKLDELESIIRSDDRKTKKWDNAKGIVKWIADKGVDVAMTFLPLLLKINK